MIYGRRLSNPDRGDCGRISYDGLSGKFNFGEKFNLVVM
jgi:hypothetical protein